MKRCIAILVALCCILFSATACAVEFTDTNGRVVSIDRPERVVSLYYSFDEAWTNAGGTLVGSVERKNIPLESGVQNLGSHSTPNMELLFSLEPDFVILSADVAAQVEIGATLEAAGIPCAYFSTKNWRGYMDMVKLFSEMTGRNDMYLKQVETVQQPIEAIIAEAAKAEDFGKRSYLLLRAYSTGVKAKDTDSTVAGRILRDMGFVNIDDGDSTLSENLSMEAILIADPDYIFVVTMGSDNEAAMESLNDMLVSNPAWNTLSAVKANRFVILDEELFHYHPNGRWAESYAFIADMLKGETP